SRRARRDRDQGGERSGAPSRGEASVDSERRPAQRDAPRSRGDERQGPCERRAPSRIAPGRERVAEATRGAGGKKRLYPGSAAEAASAVRRALSCPGRAGPAAASALPTDADDAGR